MGPWPPRVGGPELDEALDGLVESSSLTAASWAFSQNTCSDRSRYGDFDFSPRWVLPRQAGFLRTLITVDSIQSLPLMVFTPRLFTEGPSEVGRTFLPTMLCELCASAGFPPLMACNITVVGFSWFWIEDNAENLVSKRLYF